MNLDKWINAVRETMNFWNKKSQLYVKYTSRNTKPVDFQKAIFIF